jgi:PadR family transcriptional regulator
MPGLKARPTGPGNDARPDGGAPGGPLGLSQPLTYCHLPTYTLPMVLSRDIKKGSAELLILALLEERARHGYEIARLIADRSDGAITFTSATLYPALHALERQGVIRGRWEVRPGERRRRFYSLTPAGRRALEAQRAGWNRFIRALTRITNPGRVAR